MNEDKNQNVVYDLAKYHFLGNFPDALPIEHAYTHIGMYLGWAIDRHLYSHSFEEESPVLIYRFRQRQISCTLLSELWDGYLGRDIFSDEGNAFTAFYYRGGQYLTDYKAVLSHQLPSMYHVADTWVNYRALAEVITHHYTQWKKH